MDAIAASSGSQFKSPEQMADKQRDHQLRQACSDFESIILQKFLKMARESAPEGGLLDGGHAEEMYRSMQDQELAQQMAAGPGMGLGDLLYQQINNQHYNQE
ncbi:MAG: rod-binding protein [Desulfurivibrio sp.]|nr:rod-binding protein [Desulfurivibrio sp.]